MAAPARRSHKPAPLAPQPGEVAIEFRALSNVGNRQSDRFMRFGCRPRSKEPTFGRSFEARATRRFLANLAPSRLQFFSPHSPPFVTRLLRMINPSDTYQDQNIRHHPDTRNILTSNGIRSMTPSQVPSQFDVLHGDLRDASTASFRLDRGGGAQRSGYDFVHVRFLRESAAYLGLD
jgi:hypothetical protein